MARHLALYLHSCRLFSARGGTLVSLLLAGVLVALLGGAALAALSSSETRSKLAQARSDMRLLARAMEDYRGDWDVYPPGYPIGNAFGDNHIDRSLRHLTTPVAYLARVSFINPFGENLNTVSFNANDYQGTRPIYMLMNYESVVEGDFAYYAVNHGVQWRRAMMVWSAGPDCSDDNLYWAGYATPPQVSTFRNLIYDPSNGTFSRGDMALVGGDIPIPELGLDWQ